MAEIEQIPTWDLADRMRKALRSADLGVQDMADYLGVSRTAVGTWINGRNKPSGPALRLWALRCGVPFDWLAEGRATRQYTPGLVPALRLEVAA